MVPSITYLASFQAISAVGAKPIPCDISPIDFQICLTDARQRITSRTKAIMPVHYGGQLSRRTKLYEFSTEFNLRVIEDAAHSFGSSDEQGICGSNGDVICFSFDGIKNITCGEGGAVVSNDPEIIRYVKNARLLGVHSDSENRFKGTRTWEPKVTHQGWRYHMSNINAAIGIAQLKRSNSLFERRMSISKMYHKLFADHSKIQPIVAPSRWTVPHIYPILLPSSYEINSRNALRKNLLEEKNIETGCHYYPNHNLDYYRQDSTCLPLTITEQLYPRLLSLPMHPDLTNEDILFIVKSLESYL